ncbi:MAG: restriction endonuclease subunit S [bacterium]|nr:restriction endonuclease subunit S [bacterium]
MKTQIVKTKDDIRQSNAWPILPFSEVVDILDSKRVPVNRKERAKRIGKIPYYGATGQVGWIDDFLFDEELVLLGEDGAPFLDPSKPKAYLIEGKAWVNNHAHVLRAKKGLLNKFLFYQLNRLDYRPYVSGTTRLKLPQGTMKNIKLVVPPLNVQKEIIEDIETQFTRLDAGVAALKRAQANLKRYRAAVLKAAFLNKEYDEKVLGEICDLIMGQSPPGNTYNTKRKGLPFYQGKTEFGVTYPTPVKWCDRPKKIAEEGDILISVRAPVGPTNITQNKSCIGRGIAAIRPHKGIPTLYILYAIRATVDKLKEKATGTTFEAISGVHLRNHLIPLAPESVRGNIVNEVERKLSVIEKQEENIIEKLKMAGNLRNAILKQAFCDGV